jgi:hypothetical protein
MEIGDIYFYPSDQSPFVLKLTTEKTKISNTKRWRFKVIAGKSQFGSSGIFFEPSFEYDLVPIAKTHQIIRFLFTRKHLFK